MIPRDAVPVQRQLPLVVATPCYKPTALDFVVKLLFIACFSVWASAGVYTSARSPPPYRGNFACRAMPWCFDTDPATPPDVPIDRTSFERTPRFLHFIRLCWLWILHHLSQHCTAAAKPKSSSRRGIHCQQSATTNRVAT